MVKCIIGLIDELASNAESRAPLLDAVETFPKGVSLYDAHGRLLLFKRIP